MLLMIIIIIIIIIVHNFKNQITLSILFRFLFTLLKTKFDLNVIEIKVYKIWDRKAILELIYKWWHFICLFFVQILNKNKNLNNLFWSLFIGVFGLNYKLFFRVCMYVWHTKLNQSNFIHSFFFKTKLIFIVYIMMIDKL